MLRVGEARVVASRQQGERPQGLVGALRAGEVDLGRLGHHVRVLACHGHLVLHLCHAGGPCRRSACTTTTPKASPDRRRLAAGPALVLASIPCSNIRYESCPRANTMAGDRSALPRAAATARGPCAAAWAAGPATALAGGPIAPDPHERLTVRHQDSAGAAPGRGVKDHHIAPPLMSAEASNTSTRVNEAGRLGRPNPAATVVVDSVFE